MARCKNDALISKIGVEKLKKTIEVEFSVHQYLPDCRRISAKNYVSGTGAYNRFIVPKNQYECVSEGCVNTGTFYNKGAVTVYKANFNAIEFATGVVTLYSVGSEGTMEVRLSDTDQFTDADLYTIDLSQIVTAADGYKAVMVDLSKTATQEGNGWTPSALGAYISITINKLGTEDEDLIGISSISIYDSIDDFELSDAVRLACLTTVGGSWDVDAAEASCFGSGQYDESSLEGIERTITAKALTPNYWKLNPLYGKGEAVNGWDSATVEQEVVADGDYGKVTLLDKYHEECGFFNVALSEACNIADAHLVALDLPNKAELDEGHYIVIDNADGTTDIFVNKALVGQMLTIAYPKASEVEEFVLDRENLTGRATRMSYTRTYTDGTKYRFVFDNVLITSFPDEVTEEESEFEFTVNIQPDADGRYGRAYRILE